MKLVLCLTLLIAVAYCQLHQGNHHWHGANAGWYCGIVMGENCHNHDLHEKCGTDGITYINMCDLSQAHCTNNVTNQLHDGPCGPAIVTTTRSPQDVIHGSQVALDVACTILSHTNCTFVIYEKICGSDGHTYPEFCEYEKARCTHRELHVAKLGDCDA